MQNQLITVGRFLVGALILLSSPFFLFGGCSKFSEENYNECRPLVEESRLEARERESYTYDSGEYGDCRKPARNRIESDD